LQVSLVDSPEIKKINHIYFGLAEIGDSQRATKTLTYVPMFIVGSFERARVRLKLILGLDQGCQMVHFQTQNPNFILRYILEGL
jgi:hypothetical protein